MTGNQNLLSFVLVLMAENEIKKHIQYNKSSQYLFQLGKQFNR